jgi:hypothetical protein
VFVEQDMIFTDAPLQSFPELIDMMNSDSKVLMTARKAQSTNPSTIFLFAKNNRNGRSLLYDWWRQVDDFPEKISDGVDRRPYKQFRNSGLREETILGELILHGYRCQMLDPMFFFSLYLMFLFVLFLYISLLQYTTDTTALFVFRPTP